MKKHTNQWPRILFSLAAAFGVILIYSLNSTGNTLTGVQVDFYLRHQVSELEKQFQLQDRGTRSKDTCNADDKLHHPSRAYILSDFKSQKSYSVCSLSQDEIHSRLHTIEETNDYVLVITSTSETIDAKPFSWLKAPKARVVAFNSNGNNRLMTDIESIPTSEKISVQTLESTQVGFDDLRKAIHGDDIVGRENSPVPWNTDFLYIGAKIPNPKLVFDLALKLVRPKIIHVKFNPIFPPPIIFTSVFNVSDSIIMQESKTGDFWGCSLSYYSSIAQKYGYSLLQVELLEATFIRTENMYMFDDPGSEYDQWFKNFYSNSFSKDYAKTLSKIDGGLLSEWAKTENSYLLYESINATLEEENRKQFDLRIDLSRNKIEEKVGQKPFVYLAQGESTIPEHLKQELITTNSDLIFLSFLKPAEGTLYYPNSTWTEGRNRLLQEVKLREVAQGWRYKYLTFLDGDVQIAIIGEPEGVSPWRKYERFLLEYEPAVAQPDHRGAFRPSEMKMMHGNRFEAAAMFHHDAILVSYHREVCDTVLPYDPSYDHISWWYSQLIAIYKAIILYRRGVLEYYEVITWNYEHHAYPREAKFDETIQEWSSRNLPMRLRHCVIGFYTIFARNHWGSVQFRENDYGTRTYWNVPPCDYVT